MNNTLKIAFIIYVVLALTGLSAFSEADSSTCRTCFDVAPESPREVRIEYKDGTDRTACGLRCAGAMLAAYRMQDVKTIWIREHGSGKLLDAKKAFWSLGSDGIREAFSEKREAEAYSAAHNVKAADYRETMATVFAGIFDELPKSQPVANEMMGDDIAGHPKCAYCGMDRKQYAYSRVLLRYSDGSEVGLCSVHCAGIDLALHPEKGAAQIMAGTYDRKDLVDAEKAVWVLGGTKQGVMSIRGKWAFGSREDAEAFIRESGGSITSSRNIMTAAFEDMWEIIR